MSNKATLDLSGSFGLQDVEESEELSDSEFFELLNTLDDKIETKTPKDDIIKDLESMLKGRRYVDSPDEAPEGVEVQEGPQGGLWYETGDDSEESESGGGDWQELPDDVSEMELGNKEILVDSGVYTPSAYMPGIDEPPNITVEEDVPDDLPGAVDGIFDGFYLDAIDGVREVEETESEESEPEPEAEEEHDPDEWDDPPGDFEEFEDGQTLLLETEDGLQTATINFASDALISTFLDDSGEPYDVLDSDEIVGVQGEGHTERLTPDDTDDPGEILETIPFYGDADRLEGKVHENLHSNIGNTDRGIALRTLDHIEQFESMPGRAHVDFAAGSSKDRATLNVGSSGRSDTINHEWGHMVMDAHGFGIGGFAAREAMMQYDSQEDNFIQLDPDDEDYHLVYQEDGEPDSQVAALADAVNTGWQRLQEGGEENADEYNIGDNYSATNAHEFLAKTHERLQRTIATVGTGKTNWFDSHPELLPAYIEVFEPSDANKKLISHLHSERPDDSPFDEDPYPDYHPEEGEEVFKQEEHNQEFLEIQDYYRVWVGGPHDVPDEVPVHQDKEGGPAGNQYYYELPLQTMTVIPLEEEGDVDKAVQKAMVEESRKEYPTRDDLVSVGVPQKDLTLIDRVGTQAKVGDSLFGKELRKSNTSILSGVESPLSLLHLYKTVYDEGEQYSAFLNQIQKELGRRSIYGFERISKARRVLRNDEPEERNTKDSKRLSSNNGESPNE